MTLWLLVAFALARLQLKLGGFSYGSMYNGYGAIESTLSRTTPAPMAYRVLIPWLIGLIERIVPALKAHRLPALYEPLRMGLMALALWAVEAAIGTKGALVVAVLLPVTFLFDYWDWAAELFGLAAALSGNFPLAIVGGVAHGLSRETAPLVALLYGLTSGDWQGAAIIAGATMTAMILARVWAGKRRLYCDRFMWRVNLADLRRITDSRPVYLGELSMSVGVTVLTLAALPFVGWTAIVPLLLLITGWTMARAAETRVFTGCLLWIAMTFTRLTP